MNIVIIVLILVCIFPADDVMGHNTKSSNKKKWKQNEPVPLFIIQRSPPETIPQMYMLYLFPGGFTTVTATHFPFLLFYSLGLFCKYNQGGFVVIFCFVYYLRPCLSWISCYYESTTTCSNVTRKSFSLLFLISFTYSHLPLFLVVKLCMPCFMMVILFQSCSHTLLNVLYRCTGTMQYRYSKQLSSVFACIVFLLLSIIMSIKYIVTFLFTSAVSSS